VLPATKEIRRESISKRVKEQEENKKIRQSLEQPRKQEGKESHKKRLIKWKSSPQSEFNEAKRAEILIKIESNIIAWT
jgi:hypothetical protein